MSNILIKPYTRQQYADFAVMANQNGQRIEQTDNAVYVLYPYEEIQNGEIVDISQTSEYIQEQKNIQINQIILSYADIFNEFDLSYCSLICQGFDASEDYQTDRDNLISELAQKIAEVQNGQ